MYVYKLLSTSCVSAHLEYNSFKDNQVNRSTIKTYKFHPDCISGRPGFRKYADPMHHCAYHRRVGEVQNSISDLERRPSNFCRRFSNLVDGNQDRAIVAAAKYHLTFKFAVGPQQIALVRLWRQIDVARLLAKLIRILWLKKINYFVTTKTKSGNLSSLFDNIFHRLNYPF